MKKNYLQIMEQVVKCYTPEHIERYMADVVANGLQEHGFTRVTVNLGILIAHGRKAEYKERFIEMMDLCCREVPTCMLRNGENVGNEFSVKELVFCILEVEKAGILAPEYTRRWREELSKIKPFDTYCEVSEDPSVALCNWAAFGAASEQLRKYAGIGDESAFIDFQIHSQLCSFDENGMYRDPHEPIVYDMVTRLQLAAALYFGYEGDWKDALCENLEKSMDLTLLMQSVSGEIPYGGRSNQFLHNETFYAALCEYYASALKKRGDLQKAGMFKRAARRAIESILPWLAEEKVSHIKNYYDIGTQYGCEFYAYYDKYMVTTASWLYMAYAMADDTIEEVACPSEKDSFVWETSEHFHKVFAKYGEYYAQWDTNADQEYESTGLGRIHKKNAPSAICLSLPFTPTPVYELDMKNPSSLAICGGVKGKEGYLHPCDGLGTYRVIDKEVTDAYVRVKCFFESEEKQQMWETCTISSEGVVFEVEGDGDVEICFPVFEFDGKHHTEIFVQEKQVDVRYKGYCCSYTSDSEILLCDDVFANRNGHYRAASIRGEKYLALKITIDACD